MPPYLAQQSQRMAVGGSCSKRVSDGSSTEDDGDGSLGEIRPRLINQYIEAVTLDPEEHPEEEADIVNSQWPTSDPCNETLVPHSPRRELSPVGAAEDQNTGDGLRAPAGWRIDVFGKRQVSVPPWSRRL